MAGQDIKFSNHIETADDGSTFSAIRDGKGTNLPPFEGIAERVSGIRAMLLRDDDIFICTYPKSGTNWIGNIVDILLHQQKKSQKEWMPGIGLFLEKFGRDGCEKTPSPRVMMTHLPPDYLPPGLFDGTTTAKLIYVTRDIKDTIVSYYHFLSKLGQFKGTVRGLADLVLKGKMHYRDWYDHREEYSHVIKDEKRYLKLSFEDMKQEPEANVKRIAAFIGVKTSDEDIQSVLALSSVSNARAKMESMGGMLAEVGYLVYRKGESGDWKNHFTEETNAWFDVAFAKYIKEHKNRKP